MQLCVGDWNSLWLPTGSQSRSQKLHAEQRLFTCLWETRVAEERLWDHQVSQKDNVICSSPQSGWGSWKKFWSLIYVLCLSNFLPDFDCIHSFGKEAQIIFSFMLLMVHRGILCLSFCQRHWRGNRSFCLAHYPQISVLGTLDMPFLAIFVGAVVRWYLSFPVISRCWSGRDRQTTLLLMYITVVTEIPQHGPGACCAMQWNQWKTDLFTVYFLLFCFFCFKWNHDRDFKVSHCAHSAWKLSIATVRERNNKG